MWNISSPAVLAPGVSGSSVIHKVDGRTTLTAGSLLDNLHWHYVTVKRYGRQVNFTVDSQTVTAICKGEFTHLDLDTQVIAWDYYLNIGELGIMLWANDPNWLS